MAAVVGDVDGRPGGPGRGLLQVGAGQGVARLVLLQFGWNKLRLSISKLRHCLKGNISDYCPEDQKEEKSLHLFSEERASVFEATSISPDLALVIPPCCPDEAPESLPECLSSRTHRLRVYSRRRTRPSCQ